MIAVVGGVYREICVNVQVDEIFGSAGRAAVALSTTGASVALHAFLSPEAAERVEPALAGSGVELVAHGGSQWVEFRYLHALARPIIRPWPVAQEPKAIEVDAENVLVFGMLEGTARVVAQTAVLDPQGGDPAHVLSSDSKIGHLALVLNSHELRTLNKLDEPKAVATLAKQLGAEVVIVKGGATGARVYRDGKFEGVAQPYRTDNVYKIGSGDIFSTAFFDGWVRQGLSPLDAADYASRSTARYCDTKSPSLVDPALLGHLEPLKGRPQGKVYIASPFFTLADLWLVEEAARSLSEVGSSPFSPFHEIGTGDSISVATADLEALKKCSAVLAIVSGGDPGTLFEVGFAVSLGIPVVALSENGRPADATMLEGTGCLVCRDFATAVYQAAWATSS